MKLLNLIAVIPLILAAPPSLSETGYVTVLVEDAHQHPVRLVEIGIEKGASKLTKDDGEAQLPLAQTIKADDWITFQLVHSPPGKDLAIVSPWDNRIPVPSFADKTENLVKIVVVERGDRAALESGDVVLALAQKINKANAPRTADKQAPPPDPKEALLAVAKQYGLTAEDIDTAIRVLGTKTNDEEKKGIILLYEGKYAEASAALNDSLQEQEKQLEAVHEIERQKEKGIADTSFFLGQSLYEQGQYSESLQAYKKCLVYRPDDPLLLNSVAQSLYNLGNYSEAEPLLQKALTLYQAAPGEHDPAITADIINNWALVLEAKEDYPAAASAYYLAIAVDAKAFGFDSPPVARDLNNIGNLLSEKGDYTNAATAFKQAQAINEKVFGPDSPHVASNLAGLGVILKNQKNYDDAEKLYRRALEIDKKALGPDHPTVAIDMNNLAMLLDETHRDVEAEPLFRAALAIDQRVLGPDNPTVARELSNLAMLLEDNREFAEAEKLLIQAVAIDEKALGPDNPATQHLRANLAILLLNAALSRN